MHLPRGQGPVFSRVSFFSTAVVRMKAGAVKRRGSVIVTADGPVPAKLGLSAEQFCRGCKTRAVPGNADSTINYLRKFYLRYVRLYLPLYTNACDCPCLRIKGAELCHYECPKFFVEEDEVSAKDYFLRLDTLFSYIDTHASLMELDHELLASFARKCARVVAHGIQHMKSAPPATPGTTPMRPLPPSGSMGSSAGASGGGASAGAGAGPASTPLGTPLPHSPTTYPAPYTPAGAVTRGVSPQTHLECLRSFCHGCQILSLMTGDDYEYVMYLP